MLNTCALKREKCFYVYYTFAALIGAIRGSATLETLLASILLEPMQIQRKLI